MGWKTMKHGIQSLMVTQPTAEYLLFTLEVVGRLGAGSLPRPGITRTGLIRLSAAQEKIKIQNVKC